ncbi:divalent metal cation transporter, partial [Patescibacteria group bacterium]|nr:divalent metal cation transporter [Patescibacteria group bacterium]
VPFVVLLVTITAICLLLQIFVSYHTYANILKYFTFSLLAYIVAAFVIKQDWGLAIRSVLIPRIEFTQEYLFNIVAILGTTISPYLFFWQASEEVEEEIEAGKLASMGAGIPRFTNRDIKNLRFDTLAGMFFSNLVMFFVILTAASTLGAHGIRDIHSADQAAQALRPLAGDFAYLLFTIGIIGTGLLAVPVLAGSASYALSEAFGWKEGLYRKLSQAKGFYGIIIVSILIGFLINLTAIPPFKMLYYTAVLNGLCAPPLMVLILLISNNKAIMKNYTNGKFANILGCIITGFMFLCAVALLYSFFG